MKKILTKVDEARLGRAMAGLLDGSIRVVDVKRDEHMVQARIKGTRETYTVCIEHRRVWCSCMDFYARRLHCKHIAAVAIHELAVAAKARSTRSSRVQVRF